MAQIDVPRLVAEKLSTGETVVGKFATRWGDYYATSKRLLLFRSESKYISLNYPDISINLVKYGTGWAVFRVFCIIFGLVCIAVGVVGYIGPVIESGTTVTHLDAPFEVSLLLWLMGLVLIIIVLFMRYAYYQISAPAIDKKEIKKWRIERYRWGAGGADKFAAILKSAAQLESKENAS